MASLATLVEIVVVLTNASCRHIGISVTKLVRRSSFISKAGNIQLVVTCFDAILGILIASGKEDLAY